MYEHKTLLIWYLTKAQVSFDPAHHTSLSKISNRKTEQNIKKSLQHKPKTIKKTISSLQVPQKKKGIKIRKINNVSVVNLCTPFNTIRYTQYI